MATIITKCDNVYELDFINPELEWISLIAETLGITKEAVVGAAMNKGLIHYVETFCKPTEPTPDDTDIDNSVVMESPDQ